MRAGRTGRGDVAEPGAKSWWPTSCASWERRTARTTIATTPRRWRGSCVWDPRLLFPITHLPAAQQSDLAVVRVRAQLVKVRT